MQDKNKLTLIGLLALGISGMAPTDSLAYCTVPATKFAGYNLPISFLLGGLGIFCVAVCFASMAKYISNLGSVYAYNKAALGEKCGFITGWILLLAYLVIMPAHAGLVGNFVAVFFKHFHIALSINFLAFFLTFLIWLISILGIKFTSKISLVLECISLSILILLSVVIVVKAYATGNLTAKPFIPHHNLSGIGQGTVFAVLSYSGFEEICSVSQQSKIPKRNLPKALLWSVAFAPLFFTFITFVQVIGFHIQNMKAFVNSSSPLDALSAQYLGNDWAIVMDFAILISAFGDFLGCANACSYMLYAYSKEHYLPQILSNLSPKLQNPTWAITVTAISTILIYLIFGLPYGYQILYTNASTLGTIGMLVTYIMICVGALVFFKRYHHGSVFVHIIIPIIGALMLIFPLISNIYPVPKYPANLFPYLMVIWVFMGLIIRKMVINKTSK